MNAMIAMNSVEQGGTMNRRLASAVFTALAAGLAACLTLPDLVAAADSSPAAPIVATADGSVRGITHEGFYVFRGIPYAAPPTGTLRWRAAQKVAPWSAVRDATDFGADCEQPVGPESKAAANPMSEDCLTVNVLTSSLRSDKKLPVMVSIHGGAFFVGSGRFPLDEGMLNLARQGVVMVSFNYRLGRFGFFAHPALSKEHPDEPVGNYWETDQLAALEWVRKNIAKFGGDPAKVTIFGCSAGGSSVNLLVAAPAARGLFARAITESGGGLFNASRPLSKARNEAREVARRAGADGDSAAGLAKLRSLTAAQILANEQGPPDYGAIVDGKLLTDELPVVFAKGEINPVSYLVGSTSNEASIFGLMGFDAPVLEKRFGIRMADVRPVYEAGGGKLADADLLRQVQTDFIFTAGAGSLGEFTAKNGHPTYVYHFAYLSGAQRGKLPGVPHCGQAAYLFNMVKDPTPQDKQVATLVQSYWTNFVKSGDPNGAGLPHWPQFHAPAPATLVFSEQTHAVPDFEQARLKVWYDKWSQQSGVAVPQ
jgi:para-nitrobenzyl esterase